MTQEFSPKLVDAIYAAGLDISLWPLALAEAEYSLGLANAILVFQCPGVGLVTCRAGDTLLQITSSKAPERNRPGSIGRSLTQPTLMSRNLQTYAGLPARLSFAFSAEKEAETSVATHHIDLLAEHVGLALKIGVSRLVGDTRRFAPLALLDAMGVGAMMLSMEGVVLAASAAAVKRYPEANLRGGPLQLESVAATTEVLLALTSLRSGSAARQVLFSVGGGRPDSVAMLQLKDMDVSGVHATFSAYHALLLVAPIRRSIEIDPAVLKKAFALTRRESVLAAKAAKGVRVTQIAAEMAIEVSTARFMMNQVFEKAAVSSQAQLVAVLSGMASESALHAG